MPKTYYDSKENFMEYLFRIDELYRLKNSDYKILYKNQESLLNKSEKVRELLDERQAVALTEEETSIIAKYLTYRDEQIAILMQLMFKEGMKEVGRILMD